MFEILKKHVVLDRIYYRVRHIDTETERNERNESNESNEFYIYRSLSEGGVLRLCLSSGDNVLNKGYDYIQSTFVSMDLHRLAEQYDRDHKASGSSVKCTSDDIGLVGKSVATRNPVFGLHHERQRELFDPYLFVLGHCDTSCIVKHGAALQNYLKSIKGHHMFSIMMQQYPKEISEAMDYMNTALSKYQESTDILVIMHNLYSAFSDYMQHFYVLIDTVVEPFEFRYEYDLADNQSVEFNTFTVMWTKYIKYTLKHRGNGMTFLIHAVEMDIDLSFVPFGGAIPVEEIPPELIEHNELSGTYQAIVSVTPMDYKVTEYGVIDHYYPVGLYSNKIMDYAHQLPPGQDLATRKISISVNNPRRPKQVTDYTFIADLVSVWPALRRPGA